MKAYLITPQPFGEEAARKETRFILASARAGGERVIKIIHRGCSTHLVRAMRQTLAALKREERLLLYIGCDRVASQNPTAAYLFDKYPEVREDPDVAARDKEVTVAVL